MTLWRHLLCEMSFAGLILFGGTATALAFDTNPTPYDSEVFIPSTLVQRSTSQYFMLDARLPKALKGAFDRSQMIGLTGMFIGGTLNRNDTSIGAISVNDVTVYQPKDYVCSPYSADLCYDIGKFYQSKMPQIGLTGLFALDGSTMLQWGFNSGYESQKLTISPSVLLGIAKRFYLSNERDSHIIVEASRWFGASVKHRPCLDDFDKQYFCGSVSAWSEFSYDPHPESNFIKISYEKLF